MNHYTVFVVITLSVGSAVHVDHLSLVITVPADVLAPEDARTSAGTIMTTTNSMAIIMVEHSNYFELTNTSDISPSRANDPFSPSRVNDPRVDIDYTSHTFASYWCLIYVNLSAFALWENSVRIVKVPISSRKSPLSSCSCIARDPFVNAPSQWETTLHSNVISHWLGAYTKWSLHIHDKTPDNWPGQL